TNEHIVTVSQFDSVVASYARGRPAHVIRTAIHILSQPVLERMTGGFARRTEPTGIDAQMCTTIPRFCRFAHIVYGTAVGVFRGELRSIRVDGIGAPHALDHQH